MSDALKASTPNFGFGLINFDFPLWSSYEHRNWRNLDGILSSALGGFTTRGLWANDTAYLVGDRVTDDADGVVYFCLEAHTSPVTGSFAEARLASPDQWQTSIEVPKFRGDWLPGQFYAPNDIVANGSATYFAIIAHESSASFITDLANWIKISDYAEAIGFPCECRFQFASATEAKLMPWRGNRLTINQSLYEIPATGVTLSNVGLTNGWLYRVYAYMDSGVMKLEAIGDGSYLTGDWVFDAIGIPVKSGDPSRTLVGACFLNSSGQFVDSYQVRSVTSYWNRKENAVAAYLDADTVLSAATGSTDVAALNSLVDLIIWEDDLVEQTVGGLWKLGSAVETLIYFVNGTFASNPGITRLTTDTQFYCRVQSRIDNTHIFGKVRRLQNVVRVIRPSSTTVTIGGGSTSGIQKTVITATTKG